MHEHPLVSLLREHGHLRYDGEGVTQLEHAWQCGQLALQAGAPPALQLAAWLHDLGHLTSGLTDTPTLQGVDDGHEASGARLLAQYFGDAVVEPVRMHVQAKRYLVARNPAYLARLSADSVRSLGLQGGAMSAEECLAFEARPYCVDAQRLRVWDDVAKRADWELPEERLVFLELEGVIGRVVSL